MSMGLLPGVFSILNLILILVFLGIGIFILVLTIQLLLKANKLVDKKLKLMEKEEYIKYPPTDDTPKPQS